MRRAPALLVAILLLAACGREPGAIAIPTEDIPFPLARSPQATETPQAVEEQRVFFIHRERLLSIRRKIESGIPVPEGVLRALLAGPTPREQQIGITTHIPPDARLLELRLVDQIAEVDLSAEFQSPASPEAILRRVAQVVWTLVRVPGITAVRFAIDGSPVSVVVDGGGSVERPVSLPDYASVAPMR